MAAVLLNIVFLLIIDAMTLTLTMTDGNTSNTCVQDFYTSVITLLYKKQPNKFLFLFLAPWCI